ncbi:ankyrin repeat domain-containing protein [Leptospira sp. WS92.C1]
MKLIAHRKTPVYFARKIKPRQLNRTIPEVTQHNAHGKLNVFLSELGALLSMDRSADRKTGSHCSRGRDAELLPLGQVLILLFFMFFSFPTFLLSQDLSIEDRRFLSATINGNVLMAKRALHNGASVNVRDPRPNYLEQTPLMKAAWNNDAAFTRFLLEQKANVNLSDREGGTALITAVYGLSVEVIKLLLTKKVDLYAETKSGLSAAIIASDLCSLPILRMLKEAGVDLNRPTEKGYRPLYAASSHCNRKFLEYILESGADVNAVAEDGQTALFKAARFGNRDALEMLLKRGASTKFLDRDGLDAFYHYLLFGRRESTEMKGAGEIIKLFLEKDLNLDREYPDGQTALMLLLDRNILRNYLSKEKFPLISETIQQKIKDGKLKGENRFGLSLFEYSNLRKKYDFYPRDSIEFEKDFLKIEEKNPFTALQISYLFDYPRSKDLLRKLLLPILTMPKRTDLGGLEIFLWRIGFMLNEPELLRRLDQKYPDSPAGLWSLNFKAGASTGTLEIPKDPFLVDVWLRSLEKGNAILFDPEFKTSQKINAIQGLGMIVRECRVDLLERLVNKKDFFAKNTLESDDQFGYSSLFNIFYDSSFDCGNEEKETRLLRLLLEIGADPGKERWISFSPVCSSLHQAILGLMNPWKYPITFDYNSEKYQKSRKRFLKLLQIGGNPNCIGNFISDDHLNTALESVQLLGIQELEKKLLEFGALDTRKKELHWAIQTANLPQIKELVNKGAVIGYQELDLARNYDPNTFSNLLDFFNSLESPLLIQMISNIQMGRWAQGMEILKLLSKKGFSYKIRSHGKNHFKWLIALDTKDPYFNPYPSFFRTSCAISSFIELKHKKLNELRSLIDSQEYTCRGFFSSPVYRKNADLVKSKIHFFSEGIEKNIRNYGFEKVFPELEDESYFYNAYSM